MGHSPTCGPPHNRYLVHDKWPIMTIRFIDQLFSLQLAIMHQPPTVELPASSRMSPIDLSPNIVACSSIIALRGVMTMILLCSIIGDMFVIMDFPQPVGRFTSVPLLNADFTLFNCSGFRKLESSWFSVLISNKALFVYNTKLSVSSASVFRQTAAFFSC